MRSALVLMGGQSHQAVGAELLVVAGIAVTVYVNGYIKAIKLGNGPSLTRTVTGSLLYLAEMAGALIFLLGSLTGLYTAAIALVANICYMITGAWLLVVGVFDEKSKELLHTNV